MPKYDSSKLRADNPLSEYLPKRGISLKPNGREWECCCPLHGDDTPSFRVYQGKNGSQQFHCFGCGADGDVFAFVQQFDGVDFKGACEILGGDREPPGGSRTPTPSAPAVDPYAAWERRAPPKGTPTIKPGVRTPPLFNPKRPEKAPPTYIPAAVYPYRAADGAFMGYVLRVEIDGKKLTPLIQWCKNRETKAAGWCHRPFEGPRPIYRLPALAARPTAPVLIVEGEKCADAAAQALPGTVPVSWQGGGKAAGKTDWKPLTGRNVIVWPDNDAPGLSAAVEVAKFVAEAGAASVRIVELPGAEQAKGWDVADAVAAGWTKDEIVQFVRERARPWGQPTEPPTTAPEPTGDDGGRFDAPPDDQPGEHIGLTRSALKPRTQEEPQPDEEGNPDDERPVADVVDMRTRRSIPRVARWDAADLLPNGRHWKEGLHMDGKGNLKRTEVENWEVLLRDHPDMRGVFIQNEMTQVISVDRRPPWEPADRPWRMRPLVKTDAGRAQVWMNTLDDGANDYRQKSSVTGAKQAIEMVAERNKFHPVRDYLERLEREKVWDGCHRLKTPAGVAPWLVEYLNVVPTDSGLEREYGMFWLVSAVARNLTPSPEGEKADNMLVVEGPQGIGKSRALECLATMDGKAYFTSQIVDILSKDTVQITQGTVIAVCDEFTAVMKVDPEQAKNYMEKKCDKVRLPYAEAPVEIPRTFALAGTTNPTGRGYLRDVSGNRRFWPVRCKGKIDIEALADVRDQLWAEAVHLYRAGMEWWLTDEQQRLSDIETNKRMKLDEWADKLDDWLASNPSQITVKDAFDVIPVLPDRQDDAKGKRISDHLYFRGYRPQERPIKGRAPKIVYVMKGPDDD